MGHSRFFDPDNLLFRELARLVDVVGLSLLWLVLCLPVVTTGTASAALYHTAVMGMRAGDGAVLRRCLRSFRENIRQGLPVTLPVLPGILLLRLGLDIMYTNRGSTQGAVMLAVYMAVLLLPVGFLGWMFALLGRFVFTTGDLLRAALRLSVSHLPATMLTGLLLSVSAVLMGLLVWPVLFLPAVTALLLSIPMERIFAQYREK